VEVFDGLAKDHGFSREDLMVDAVGALFSYFRNTIPGIREKLDYRVQYWPSGGSADPVGDYNGQKYILALKLAGFESFHDNPMRFLEVHAGYYARSTARGDNERHLYAGLGLNLNEVFFSTPASRQTWVGSIVSPAFEYLQVPYTSLNSDFSR
jgi:hypothetical protein